MYAKVEEPVAVAEEPADEPARVRRRRRHEHPEREAQREVDAERDREEQVARVVRRLVGHGAEEEHDAQDREGDDEALDEGRLQLAPDVARDLLPRVQAHALAHGLLPLGPGHGAVLVAHLEEGRVDRLDARRAELLEPRVAALVQKPVHLRGLVSARASSLKVT